MISYFGAMENFKHISHDFIPELSWGDHIPMIWGQGEDGVWRAFSPKHFVTVLDGVRVKWEYDASGYYRPDLSCVPQELQVALESGKFQDCDYGYSVKIVEWLAPIPANWKCYPNGQVTVRPVSFATKSGDKWIGFLPIYHAIYVGCQILERGNLSSDEALDTDDFQLLAYHKGGEAPNPLLWLRKNDDPNCSLWPCYVMINQEETRIVDASEGLLAPRIPTKMEIEEQVSRNRNWGYRDELSFIRDLAQSEDLLVRIKGDDFAMQFQYILHACKITWDKDGTDVVFVGEDSIFNVTASLRPYYEHFLSRRGCEHRPIPEVFNEICAILKKLGYTITI